MGEGFQIEWRVDAEEGSVEGVDEIINNLEQTSGEDIDQVEIRRPLAVTGIVTALSIITSVTTITVGLIQIIEYLSEEDQTAEIIIIAPCGEDIDVEELTSVASQVQVVQREDGC